MSTLRERILSAPDLEEELVEIPQWDEKLLIRGMDGLARAKFLRAVSGGGRDATGEVDLVKFYPTLIIKCAFDPDDPETPVFEDADRDALNSKSGAALDTVAKVALRLSGLGADSVDEAVTDLKETPGSDST